MLRTPWSFLEELLRPRGVEIAEVGGVHDADMRAHRVLGAIEVEVAVSSRWRCRQVRDDIPAEAVAASQAEFGTPVVGKRLLVGSGTRHSQYACDAYQRPDDSLRETWFYRGLAKHVMWHAPGACG